MSNTNTFEIGQIITAEDSRYYMSAVVWCNANNATIKDIGNGQYEIIAIPEPTTEELNQQRIAEIDVELAQLDTKSIRPSRNLAVGIDEESVVNGVLVKDSVAIATIRTRVEVLRAERATLTPPVVPTVLNL